MKQIKNLIRLTIVVTGLGVSASAMAEDVLNIQKKMNNVLQNCNDNLQLMAGEFYTNHGYFPGSNISASPVLTRASEFDALETIINQCMLSKFVGGTSYVEFSDDDLESWDTALTS